VSKILQLKNIQHILQNNTDNVIIFNFDEGKFIINYSIKTNKNKCELLNLFNVLHTCKTEITTGDEGVLK